MTPREWLQPMFICAYRPFFLLTAASATAAMLVWLLLLNGALGAWQPPGGILLWHAHELLFGFATAAVAGFALTAIPEFTATPAITTRPLIHLVSLWLLARLAYLLAAYWPAALGLWPAALLNLAFWAAMLVLLAPRLWRDPGRQHLSFAWAMALLGAVQIGFFAASLVGADAMAWLRAATGAMMILIVIATSRISMSVVNGQIEEGRPGAPAPTNRYLARPPRRHLAIFCIALCSASELLLGHHPVSGWTALAAAAAMLNLLNDWHIGRPLFNRWALLLYAGYWLLALGYAAMGAAWLGAPLPPSSGRHLLSSGALSLAVLAVMAMVSRIHTGLWLDRRPWLPLCAVTLLIAAVLRAWAGLPGMSSSALLMIAGLLWAGCFAVYLGYAWPGLARPRTDGQEGCAAPRAAAPDSREA